MIYFKDYDFEKLKEIKNKSQVIETKENGNKVYYSDLIFTFDTETTSYYIKNGKVINFDYSKDSSYYEDAKKQGLMYIWMFGIEDTVLYGRTYTELKDFVIKIKEIFNPIKLFVYVHNLSFDFQFILNAFGLNVETFQRKSHKVMKANFPDYNMVFRDSLILTNKSLEKSAKDYNLKISKQVGLLDYTKILRTPYTKLTEEELKYCEFDIKVLYELIKIFKKRFKSVYNIPMTQTSIVRREIKRLFFKNKKYHHLMSLIAPRNKDEYGLLNRVFIGGYTHSNRFNTGRVITGDIYSYDITSSYPAVMCIEKYPMTKFFETDLELNQIDTDKYAYIVDFTVEGVNSINSNTFLSLSKAKGHDDDGNKIYVKSPEVDNGRLVSFSSGRFELIDVDFITFFENYDFDSIQFNHIYISRKQYLPKELILFILKLFNDKTKYKNIDDSLCKTSKEMLNSIFGMTCTALFTEPCEFINGEWKKGEWTDDMVNEKLSEIANKNGINLYYGWAPWISGYGRRHLWKVLSKIDSDAIYCDTDSIKFINKKNLKYFEEDKKEIEAKIDAVCKYYDIDKSLFQPVNPKGIKSYLGYFDEERTYKQFITLGAKKYAYSYFENRFDYNRQKEEFDTKEREKHDKDENYKIQEFEPYLHITISGVTKEGANALYELTDFKTGFTFNYEQSGKLTAFYNNNQEKAVFPDGYIDDGKYGICLMPTTYTIGISEDYSELLEYTNDFDFDF